MGSASQRERERWQLNAQRLRLVCVLVASEIEALFTIKMAIRVTGDQCGVWLARNTALSPL